MNNLITSADRKALVISYAMLEAKGSDWCAAFYNNLFEEYPVTKDLFKGDLKEQADKLSSLVWMAISLLEDERRLIATAEDLGKRHLYYGTKEEDYPIVKRVLLRTIEEELEGKFTSEMSEAWSSVYDALASVMIQGARQAERLPKPTDS